MIDLPLRKNHGRKSVFNRRDGADDTHHFLGAQTDNGDSKLIGEVSQSVQEALLFCGGANFGEIHLVECKDANLDFRQRIQDEHELLLGRGTGAKSFAQLQQDGTVQPRLIGEAGALYI
jgi:hypothetical protein